MRHLLLRTSLAITCAWSIPAGAQLRYTVDLRNPASHSAAVTLEVDSLPARDTVFQFAATAPGTYQTMNIGRFVRGLRATDARGRTIPTRQLTVNSWRIGDPRRVRRIQYDILDTWNTPVTEFPIYPMAGSAIEPDHALLNAHALFGFPRSMQSSPVTVRLRAPRGWKVVTPLTKGRRGYEAESYDHAVDSPFLLGRNLTTSTLEVGGIPVRIAVHSRRGVNADQLRESMRGTLAAAGQFLGKLPVDRYVFLFRFAPQKEQQAMGAWEHGESSAYVLPDTTWHDAIGVRASDIAAHEFFHIVTPLNVHSEIIEHFNFETPVPSEHLWLYEGLTEWASEKMQLDGGLRSLDGYLQAVAQKWNTDRARYDTTYSLSKLAATSFTLEGARQYGNIYQRGAIVSGLLDIKLLQLSDGRYGLRNLVVDLARDYGRKRPFPEDSLFQIIAARTSPEVLDFFTRYVRGTERPPVKEYYALLGIDLIETELGLPKQFVVKPDPTPQQLKLREAWLRSGSPVPGQ